MKIIEGMQDKIVREMVADDVKLESSLASVLISLQKHKQAVM